MTEIEQEKFRAEFKHIVWLNSEIATSNGRLRNLHAWDKNGSHNKAIIKELDIKKQIQEKLKVALKGADYEEWKAVSKRLSKLTSRLKTAKVTLSNCTSEIALLKTL